MRPAWQLAARTQQQRSGTQQTQMQPPPPAPSFAPSPYAPPAATARSSFDDEFGDGSDLADSADMIDAALAGSGMQPQQTMQTMQSMQPQQPQMPLQQPFQPQPPFQQMQQPPMQQQHAPQMQQFAPQQHQLQQPQQFHAPMRQAPVPMQPQQQPQHQLQPQPQPQSAPQFAPPFVPPQPPPQPTSFRQTIQRQSSAPSHPIPPAQQLQQHSPAQPQAQMPPQMPLQMLPPQSHPPIQPRMQTPQTHAPPMHVQMQPQQVQQQPPPQPAAPIPHQPLYAPAPFATANTFVNNAAAPAPVPAVDSVPSRVASPGPDPATAALSSELAALRAALAAKDEELAKKSGEVSVLRQRQEQAAREQLAKTIQLSQSNSSKPFPSSQSHFPSSQHTRHADSAQQQQLTRMSQQVSAMQAQKESSDQQAAEAAAENARLKRSMEQMQMQMQQREQQLQLEQQQRAQGAGTITHAGTKRAHPETSAPRATAVPNGLPPSAAAANRPVAPPAVPSPSPASAPVPPSSAASATAPGQSLLLASSWRSPFGSSSLDPRWTAPPLLRPSYVLRTHVPLKPLEGMLAQLQQIRALIAPPPASSSLRRAHTVLSSSNTQPTVKLEGQEQKPLTSGATAAPTIHESQMIHRLCDHVRLSLENVLHSPSVPLSTLLSLLRQTLLFCCSTSHSRFDGISGGNSVAKVEKPEKSDRSVKLEPPAIPDPLEERKHSDATAAATAESLSTSSSIGEDRSPKRQLVRLLLQVLYFCVSQDADEESSSVQICREIMGLPSSSAEPLPVQEEPPSAAVLPHLNHSSWSWGAPTTADPPAADVAMSDVPSSSAPVAQLADAMSWATLLKRLLHDALSALTVERANAAVPVTAVLELLMGTIQLSLANGIEKPSHSTAAQLRSNRAAEDKLLKSWLPRLTHVLLALNGAATNRSWKALASPSPPVQAVYASIADLLVRWCQWWPAQIASRVLQPATSVVVTSASYSTAQSGSLGAHCSCNVLELLFLWANRLGSGATSGLSNAAAAATGTLQRSDWMLLSLQLLSAHHRCGVEQKNVPNSATPSVCPVHARECGLVAPLPDSALLPTVFALFTLPFAQFRVLCQTFQQSVEGMLANAQQRMQLHAQTTNPSDVAPSVEMRSCIAAHAATVQYLQASLRLLLVVLQPRRRSWRDLHSQLAAVDADVVATMNAREAQTPPPPLHARNNRAVSNGAPGGNGGDASATASEVPSMLMLMQSVREACEQIAAFDALERTATAQQPQPSAWTSTVAMAVELGSWFAS